MEHLVMKYMKKEDLELQNYGSNTALWIVAASGNLKMVKLMVERNRALVIIPGRDDVMPLLAAALFGNYDVVKYLYECHYSLESWELDAFRNHRTTCSI
ncbi:hypothetical protein L1887_08151 [Cichorium endivia]|nr:hypothetical protein L1887_08151 [Cichorium endivia]